MLKFKSNENLKFSGIIFTWNCHYMSWNVIHNFLYFSIYYIIFLKIKWERVLYSTTHYAYCSLNIHYNLDESILHAYIHLKVSEVNRQARLSISFEKRIEVWEEKAQHHKSSSIKVTYKWGWLFCKHSSLESKNTLS